MKQVFEGPLYTMTSVGRARASGSRAITSSIRMPLQGMATVLTPIGYPCDLSNAIAFLTHRSEKSGSSIDIPVVSPVSS
jgi:hypothetical protein